MKKRIIATIFCIALAYIIVQPLDASAASVWSFRSAQGAIENGGITMTNHQYMNFDLLKNNTLITEAKDMADDYSVVWMSEDQDIVWVNKQTGQARANKFDRFTEDYGTVKISAVITNVKTGKQITRSFNVVVDNREPDPEPTVTPFPEVTATPTPTPQVEPEEKDETDTTYSKSGIKKLTLGDNWKTDVSVLLDTIDFSFEGKVLKASDILGISAVDCVEIGDPTYKVYIRTVSLKVRVKALNPLWESADHYVVEKVEINHYFNIEE